MTDKAHCRLGGSVASIFTNCTAAPALWEGRERKATAFTREGTAAHAVAEDTLGRSVRHALKNKGNAAHALAQQMLGATLVVEGEEVTVDQEMVQAVSLYVNTIQSIQAWADWFAIEQGFTLDRLFDGNPPEPLFGTADFVAVRGTSLIVMDLKYGKGVPVHAEYDGHGNPQLLYYGLGAFLWLEENHPELAANIKSVDLAICQPRVREELSEFHIDLIDLLVWGENVLKEAVLSINGMGAPTTFKAGSWCRWCRGASACPELHKQAQEAAKTTFPPLAQSFTPALPPAHSLSDAELGEALNRAELVAVWLSALKSEAEARLSEGAPVPGWKLVGKRGTRKWIDPAVAADFLEGEGLSPDQIFDQGLKSPAQVEKELKNAGVPARRAKELLTSLTSSDSTGNTLVPATDPRQAVLGSASQVFTPIP